jgi:hypothetical protein
VRQRRVGGVLAAVSVAAGSCGVLAIGLLAPPDNTGIGSSDGATRSGWPVADAFSALGTVSWRADDPKTSAVAGSARGGGTAPAAQQPPPVVDPPPERFVAQNSSGLPLAGEATAAGCTAALDYLTAYAAPGFWLVCPGDARGHQAMTVCESGTSPCSVMRIIVIADACPAAYMNEASNSWSLLGVSDAPVDPYGSCA